MEIFAPLTKVLNVNARTGNFIGGGFLIVAVAIYATGFIKDGDVGPIRLAVYILAFGIVVLALSGLPLLARTALAWLITLLFSAFLVAVFLQVLTAGRMHWAPARCLLSFGFDSSCERVLVTSADIAGADVVSTARPDDAPAVVPPPAPDPGDAELTTTGPDRALSVVNVQFAGFQRSKVVALSEELVAGGWNVSEAQRGGERLAAADGLNEIRFFRPTDRPMAEALATDVVTALGRTIEVKDFSSSAAARSAKPGLLEVWIGL